jgi:translation elongation factor P/translation initiation factor 5A
MNSGTINVNDFKTGVTIEIDQQPYRVLGEIKLA